MKLPYENELYELRKWIDNTNATLNMQFLHTSQEIQRVYQWINAITMGIQTDYPFYAATLPRIASILFIDNGMGTFILNQAAFGELVIIIRHIEAEPVVVQFWPAIHPRIVNVSHEWSLFNRSRKGSQRSRISSARKVFGVKTRHSSSSEDW